MLKKNLTQCYTVCLLFVVVVAVAFFFLRGGTVTCGSLFLHPNQQLKVKL